MKSADLDKEIYSFSRATGWVQGELPLPPGFRRSEQTGRIVRE